MELQSRIDRIERCLGMEEADDADLETRVERIERRLGLLRSRYTVSSIVALVGMEFAVEARAIIGLPRTAPVCRARFAVCWLAQEALHLPLATIGEKIGGRDHSSILNAVWRAEDLREADAEFREVTDRLLAVLQQKEN